MAENREANVADGVPGTPSIREVRSERPGSEFGWDGNPVHGLRRVNLRAEIDTSPPFGSVKEAVTRFGGSGPWIPLYKLGEAFSNIEDFDIKKVEEQAAELEKDLIVKELETLDVLEELGATKRIVEDLKQKLQREALKFVTPDADVLEQVETSIIKEMNGENYGNVVDKQEQILQSPFPCSVTSPDVILMELNQAKINLGQTINELGVIQSSVESLNKKMKKEKIFIERTRERLELKFAAVAAQSKAQEQTILNPPASHAETSNTFDNLASVKRDFSPVSEMYNGMVETRGPEVLRSLPMCEEHGFSIKTAEMRWLAAKKMEEAARAAEAIALAEMNALSITDRSSGFAMPEYENVTFGLSERLPLNPRAQIPEESTLKKVVDSKFPIDETRISKLTILTKLQEATEEVLHSKKVLTEALNRVETANRKQHAATEALRQWIPENDMKGRVVYNSTNCINFNQAGNYQDCPLPEVTRSTIVNNDPKPVLRPTTSMRDVLSRKQVPEGYATRREMEEHTERQKVALSQMLRALREDLTLPAKVEKDLGSDQKQFVPQRKRFGFIQISLPYAKPSKRRAS